MFSSATLLLALLALLHTSTTYAVPSKPAFVPSRSSSSSKNTIQAMSEKPCANTQGAIDLTAHPSTLPGDPSLILTTNVDLGDKKMDIMKACSKAISAATGKPESYIAVCINDNASMIFGGSDAPLALGCMYSIGAIAMESNGKVQASVTEQLEPFGVTGDRIYINFFDVPRANVGWNGATFAH